MGRRPADKSLSLDLGNFSSLPEEAPEKPAAVTLSMDEMKSLEDQARQEVEAETKAQLRKTFLEKTKADLKKQRLFQAGISDTGEDLAYIMIDLPKFSNRITIDGVSYLHGVGYYFAKNKAATIREVMARQWLHHAEINGLNTNDYLGVKPQAPVLHGKKAA